VVRVCVTYTVAGYFLPPHYARFARAYPDIKVELTELPRPAIEQGLRDDAFDFAVMLVSNLQDRNTLAFETLFRSRRRLWLPVEHPLLSAESISLADVARLPYVMLTVDEANQTASRYWAPTGLSPNVIFVTSSVEAVRSMVADGLGVTVLSDMVYRPWSLEGLRIEQRNCEPRAEHGRRPRLADEQEARLDGARLRRFPQPVDQPRRVNQKLGNDRMTFFYR
jgi:DNA-binding transcriptional LysR family regulator